MERAGARHAYSRRSGLKLLIEAVDVSQLDEIMVVIERQLNDHLSDDQTLAFDWYCQR
ncbi:hypothetical protein [Rhizobium gallicum]|uniref:hypothetical protein n=1 Tax=Rhizobium gallicum TaxID=56730 RepID=UPI001EF9541F|nr:hypothetical protein [Rhizobium gallicum]ULJ76543.1 hypothetical protein L2W42_29720 [Rhizobium gallicum]